MVDVSDPRAGQQGHGTGAGDVDAAIAALLLSVAHDVKITSSDLRPRRLNHRFQFPTELVTAGWIAP